MLPQESRNSLELRAAAALELKRRRSKEYTVWGVYNPEGKLLRCIQYDHPSQSYKEVNKKPVVHIAEVFEPVLLHYAPVIAIKGGRGSGKSEFAASFEAAMVKDFGDKVACFREFQNSISDSVHSIIARKITDHGFVGFDVQDSKILFNGNEAFKFRGTGRNPEGLKSMDGFKRFWGEEAQAFSKKSIELIEPTLRLEGSQILYTLNPQSAADPFSQEYLVPYDHLIKDGFYLDENIMIIEANWRDNPWFPENLNKKRIKNKENWDRARYDHVWEGAYNDTIEGALIKPEWFDAAIDLHKNPKFEKDMKPLGYTVTAHDPSDAGYDSKGVAVRQGSVVKFVDEMTQGEIDAGCEWALNIAKKYDSNWFVWDGDGMGAGLKGQIKRGLQGSRMSPHMYKGSLSGVGQDNAKKRYEPMDGESRRSLYKDTFKNNRAQYSVALADRFYNSYRALVKGEYVDPDTMISIDSEGVDNMIKLRSEVCRIPEKINNSGLRQIMTKEEMKKLEIDSPNMFDSLVMAFANPPEVERKEFKPMKRKF